MSAPASEFIVRVPKKSDLIRYSVLKFNTSDNVDPMRWTPETELNLQRVDNKQVVLSTEAVQEYGEGSEYGKAAREEARRKKYGRRARNYHLDNQPWQLSFLDVDNRERRMNGIREGEGHSDNWVFLKNGNEFHAYKVDDTHRFMPAIKHKTLDIDQAEEKFLERNKVMNQFALKAQIQSQLKNNEEDGEQMEVKARTLKIKDEYSSGDSGDESGNEDEKREKKKKSKKAAAAKPKKDKRQRVENGDDVAKYESSDGEDEGREYDYMSDSGSDSDREEVKAEERIEKELVAVGDESGLKKMIGSDEEDSDSEDEDFTKKLLNRDEDKPKSNFDIEERDSSGSDSDDPDKNKVDSLVFLPKKEMAKEPSNNAKKRPAVITSTEEGGEVKKPKMEPVSVPGQFVEGLNEETVRKYLRRKPHTTKELINKVKTKCGDMTKAEIVTKLASILKAIEPHQFKQKQGKKDVLFFSLANTLA